MVRIRSILLIFSLSIVFGQILVLPVQAAKRRLAVVPMIQPATNSRQIQFVYDNLTQQLLEAQKAKLVSQSDLIDYFLKEQTREVAVSAGDELYLAAKQDYLQFQTKQALKKLDKALTEYQEHPGNQGGAYEAYLLKALIEMEKGQSNKAKKSLAKAIPYFVDQSQLKDNFYPPRFRKMYQSVYKKFKEDNNLVPLQVQVAGKEKTGMIYVNGVPRVRGGGLKIDVIPEQILFLQVGQDGKLYKVKPKADKNNKIRIRGQISRSKKGEISAIGFETTTPNLIQEAQWLGKDIKAQRVALMYLQKQKGFYRMSLNVVDVDSGKITEPKHFDIANLKKDIHKANLLASQYLMSLDKKDFKESRDDSMPILIGKKKSSKAAFVVIGAAVLAAGVGALVLTSGGSSNASSSSAPEETDVDVRIDLPGSL